ncbi:MAG: type II secretion system protein GspM [Myxococcaceae bacterium]
MDQLRQLWADAQLWLSGLSRREKILLGSATTAVLGFILFVTLLALANSADETRRRTAAKLTQLSEAQALSQSYAEAERKRKGDEAQLSTSGVSLITYLVDRGTQAGLDIPALTPKADAPVGDGRIIESTVELTLTDVPLSRLVTFLLAVEHGPGMVRVKSLRLEPRPKDNVLTAWATVAAYKLKEGP